MPTAFLLDIAGHAGIESLGGLGFGCLVFLCHHDHFRGRLRPLNRLVHSRAWRWTVLVVLAAVSSAATVALIDGQRLAAGVDVFAIGVLAHMGFEALGGGARAALAKACVRFSKCARLLVLCAVYLALAAVCIETIDRLLGG